jgi:hypothetical protein
MPSAKGRETLMQAETRDVVIGAKKMTNNFKIK